MTSPRFRFAGRLFVRRERKSWLRAAGAVVFVAAIGVPGVGRAANAGLGRVVAFGDYLFDRGEYQKAVVEYLRFSFLARDDANPEIQFRLGRARLRLGQYAKARLEFDAGIAACDRKSLVDSLRFGRAAADALERIRVSDGVSAAAPDASTTTSDVSLPCRGRLAATIETMLSRSWREALGDLGAETPVPEPSGEGACFGRLAETRSELHRVCLDALTLPRKSPAMAALLSGVLPGFGKIYTGHVSDGLFSLGLVAATAWMSYNGFDDGGTNSVKGWVFAVTSGVLYAGNIYGGYAAASAFNTRHENNLQHRFRLIVFRWALF